MTKNRSTRKIVLIHFMILKKPKEIAVSTFVVLLLEECRTRSTRNTKTCCRVSSL